MKRLLALALLLVGCATAPPAPCGVDGGPCRPVAIGGALVVGCECGRR